MALTERLQVLVTPQMRRALQQRAEQEAKSVGELVRGFVEVGLERAPLEERLRIVEGIRRMRWPVSDPQTMKHESLRGRFGR